VIIFTVGCSRWFITNYFQVGSDVAGLTTTAEKTLDGKHYVLSGEKKWVTQGRWATHGLVAARTGPVGAKGISMFIVPLDNEKISKRKIENSGVSSSGKNILSQVP
jgi:alkylation response protein AidB-like acyl-CoA dehydrogenase